MFARIVEFSPHSDAAAQFVWIIQEKALPMVQAQPRCICAFVELAHSAELAVLGVSVWHSKADAERYSFGCYPDIEEMVRPFLKCSPKLRTFEVKEIGNVLVRGSALARRTLPPARWM